MELVILNIGLDLGVISPALFSMMVMMALITTFMTTPLLEWIYPVREIRMDAEMALSPPRWAEQSLGQDGALVMSSGSHSNGSAARDALLPKVEERAVSRLPRLDLPPRTLS